MARIICTSERLNLEVLEQEHFNGLSELLARPKVMEHFKKTLNKEESQLFLNRIKHKQAIDKCSFWAMMRKKDNVFIGICGILIQEVDKVIEFEVGYRVNDKYWNKGYATEAAKACMNYAKESLAATSIISCILPENISSRKVAEKNGLTVEKESEFHGYQVLVYRKQL